MHLNLQQVIWSVTTPRRLPVVLQFGNQVRILDYNAEYTARKFVELREETNLHTCLTCKLLTSTCNMRVYE